MKRLLCLGFIVFALVACKAPDENSESEKPESENPGNENEEGTSAESSGDNANTHPSVAPATAGQLTAWLKATPEKTLGPIELGPNRQKPADLPRVVPANLGDVADDLLSDIGTSQVAARGTVVQRDGKHLAMLGDQELFAIEDLVHPERCTPHTNDGQIVIFEGSPTIALLFTEGFVQWRAFDKEQDCMMGMDEWHEVQVEDLLFEREWMPDDATGPLTVELDIDAFDGKEILLFSAHGVGLYGSDGKPLFEAFVPPNATWPQAFGTETAEEGAAYGSVNIWTNSAGVVMETNSTSNHGAYNRHFLISLAATPAPADPATKSEPQYLRFKSELAEDTNKTEGDFEIDTEVRDDIYTYPGAGGRFVYRSQRKGVSAMNECEDEDDPCCYGSQQSEWDARSWTFVTTAGVEVEIPIGSDDIETTTDPESCADRYPK